jgi:hypothetical protein
VLKYNFKHSTGKEGAPSIYNDQIIGVHDGIGTDGKTNYGSLINIIVCLDFICPTLKLFQTKYGQPRDRENYSMKGMNDLLTKFNAQDH